MTDATRPRGAALSRDSENWLWRTLRDLSALRGQEDSLAEEVEVGSAEHLAFDHLKRCG
jgi:hypothetical protein